MGSDAPETVAEIVAAHRAGAMTPAQTVARSYQRIRDHNDPAVFISLRDEKDALAEAEALPTKDAARASALRRAGRRQGQYRRRGMPTTAACPAFSYLPAQDFDGGRKTARGGRHHHRQDQPRPVRDRARRRAFALRHPRNPVRGDLIPGGSSSGSAVAVSAGLVPLALGTDTAGSGRVPAMLNNIVGLKPSLGLISTSGVVPACRTLDCVSIFTLTVDDAMTALTAMAAPDAADPFSRDRPLGAMAAFPAKLRLGVPRDGH